jgi:hypothetical protein
VSLDVVCPRCEFRLQLPMTMAGRTIRCPNPDCTSAFEVPPPVAEIVEVAKPQPAMKPKPKPPQAPKPKEVRWEATPDAKPKEVRWSEESISAAKPKEVRWSDEAESKPKPVPRPRPASAADTAADDDDRPIQTTTRKRKTNRSPMILAGLATLLILGGIGLAAFIFLSRERNERRLAESAEQAYKAGDFGAARRDFAELANNHPASEQQPRYAFFENLSQLQSEVQQLGAAGHPEDALGSFAKFLERHGESSFTKPGGGSGSEIVVLARKLAGISLAFCLECLNEHRTDRNGTTLDSPARIAGRARVLLAEVERFRDKDSPSSKDILLKFDAFDAALTAERKKSAALLDWQTKLSRPTHAKLEEFEAAMSQQGLSEDPNARSISNAARREILGRIRFVPERRPAQAFPDGQAERGLGAFPVAGSSAASKPEGAPEQTCFAVSGGCLFACDAYTGQFLWGRRIAEPTQPRSILDLPTITTLPGPSSDVALIGFPHGLGAFKVRTGQPVWYQSFPAPCRAKPAVSGNRVFAALLDEAGTIAALNLGTGELLGTIALQQPHGSNPQVLPSVASGKPQLLAVGQARQAYLFDVGSDDSNPLTCTAVPVTGHASSSVLVDPRLISTGGQPRMILITASGSTGSKLTIHSLPASGMGPPVPEWVAPKVLEKPLMGWPWHPPVNDGERLAFATDSGAVGWYGWKSPGEGLFPLLPEPVAEPGDTVSRSCIAAMADDTLWAVAGENLVRYQASVGPQGLRMIPFGKPRRVGEAVGPAQSFPRSNLAVLRVKPAGLEPHQLMAFDTERGDVLWQVELRVE